MKNKPNMKRWDVLRGEGAGIRLRVNHETRPPPPQHYICPGVQSLRKEMGNWPKSESDKMSFEGKSGLISLQKKGFRFMRLQRSVAHSSAVSSPSFLGSSWSVSSFIRLQVLCGQESYLSFLWIHWCLYRVRCLLLVCLGHWVIGEEDGC